MISDVKTAIKTAIEGALSIRCHTSIPVVFTPPCAYLQTGPANYQIVFGTTKSERTIIVTLLIARAEDLESAQAKVDAYLMPTGASSMKLAIEQTTLSSYGDFVRVVDDTGVIPLTFNQTEYIGCRWHVVVMI